MNGADRRDRGAPRNVGHLDHLVAEQDVDQAKAPADDSRVPEQPPHFLRPRVGDDVVVLRPPVEHQVAHAATHQAGVPAALAEPAQDLLSAGGEPARCDGMLGARQNGGRGPALPSGQGINGGFSGAARLRPRGRARRIAGSRPVAAGARPLLLHAARRHGSGRAARRQCGRRDRFAPATWCPATSGASRST